MLSPKTSLLVLESDGDYARFGIDRRALADVLVADGGRVGLLSRAQPQLVAKPAQPHQPAVPSAKPKPTYALRAPAAEKTIDAKGAAPDSPSRARDLEPMKKADEE